MKTKEYRPDDRDPVEARATLTERLPVETTIHRSDQAPQQVFGVLVELAAKHVEAYFSDLYHDAMKIQEIDWTRPKTFFYATGTCGTNIEFESTCADIRPAVEHGRPNLYYLRYEYHPRLKDSFNLKIEKASLPATRFQ